MTSSSSSIREFCLNHALFSHHDHTHNFEQFDKGRPGYDFKSLLGYAGADLATAAGARPVESADQEARVAAHWSRIRTTGYGRAVTLGCRALFDLDYAVENFEAITEALRKAIDGKSAAEVYDYFLREKANNRWVLQDMHFMPGNDLAFKEGIYPDYYRHAWRMDGLFTITDAGPVETLARTTGIDVLSLDDLVEAMNANIDKFRATGRLAAFKIGIAYGRDLVVGDPTRHAAEREASAKAAIQKTIAEVVDLTGRDGFDRALLLLEVLKRVHGGTTAYKEKQGVIKALLDVAERGASSE